MKMLYVLAMSALCTFIMSVSFVSVVSADELPTARAGQGYLSMLNETTGQSSFTMVASSANGDPLVGDGYNWPGRFDLRVIIPMSMWSCRLSFFSITGDFGEGMGGLVKVYSSSDLYPSPIRYGSFTLNSFSRSADGSVNTFNATFDQDVIYSVCPLIKTSWQGDLVYHTLPEPVVPEPATTTLVIVSGIVLFSARRKK